MEPKWAFLRPWCAPVLGLLSIAPVYPRDPTQPPSHGVNVSICAPSSDSPTPNADKTALQPVIRALVVLHLVARVDHEAWKSLLTEYCGLSVQSPCGAFQSDNFQPFYVIRLDSEASSAGIWAADTIRALDTASNGREDEEMNSILQQIASLGDPIESVIEIPIVFELEIESMDHGVMLADLAHNLLAERRESDQKISDRPLVGDHTESGAIHHIRWTFVAQSMEMKLSTFTYLAEADMAAQTEKLVTTFSHKLLFPALKLEFGVKSMYNRLETTGFVGQTIYRVVCGPADVRRAQVQNLELICCLPRFAGVCLALGSQFSLTSADLLLEMWDMATADRMWMWQWLAYGLFHATSRSSLSKLSLRAVAIGEEEVNAISSVMSSENPLSLMLSSRGFANRRISSNLDTTQAAWQPVILRRGARVHLLGEHPPFSLGSWMLKHDVQGVAACSDGETSDLVHVVLPGYGICCADRTWLEPAPQPTAQKTSVTKLTLKFCVELDRSPALSRFFQLVGLPLTFLEIKAMGSLCLAESLKWCPNLKTLIARGGVRIDTVPFLQVYQSHDLRIERVECEFDDMALLLREVSDKNTNLARRLRRLRHRFYSRSVLRFDPILTNVLEMLRANRRLEYFDLVGPGYPSDGILVTIGAHDGELLPVAKERLPIKCRLAFLSALGHSEHSSEAKQNELRSSVAASATMLPFMGLNALALVFEFAAICTQRHVSISYDWY